ncbi:MAG: hypothetical protein JW871_07640 [Endomicrobiales bacterium]|nr:hypothetical protein [Endomicrobiales bacterium]
MKVRNNKGFSIIGFLISTVIIALLSWYFFKVYMVKSESGRSIKKELADQGIKTDSYADMLQSAKEKADEVNKKLKKRENTLNEITGD